MNFKTKEGVKVFNKSFRLSLVLVLFALGMQGCMCGKEESATTEEATATTEAAPAPTPAGEAAPAAPAEGETHDAHAE